MACAVNGIIHPDKIKINHNLQPGNVILLTKPIGTGVLSTALKNGALSEEDIPEVIDSMRMLNQKPAQLFDTFQISACTDVTGFGLLGHLWEMIQGYKFKCPFECKSDQFF